MMGPHAKLFTFPTMSANVIRIHSLRIILKALKALGYKNDKTGVPAFKVCPEQSENPAAMRKPIICPFA
jgi:hypothetical protein